MADWIFIHRMQGSGGFIIFIHRLQGSGGSPNEYSVSVCRGQVDCRLDIHSPYARVRRISNIYSPFAGVRRIIE
jgi:hypothetical protein